MSNNEHQSRPLQVCVKRARRLISRLWPVGLLLIAPILSPVLARQADGGVWDGCRSCAFGGVYVVPCLL
eukprot:18426-Eustigmatos_ZCMA.PRE.1